MNEADAMLAACRMLDDTNLTKALSRLVDSERAALADVLAHLTVFHERRLSDSKGYPSLYDYCVRVLRYSRRAAARRISIAKIAGAFPPLLEAVRTGGLSLCAAATLAPYLTPENRADLLQRALGLDLDAVLLVVGSLGNGRPRRDDVRLVMGVPKAEEQTLGPAPEPAAAPAESAPSAPERKELASKDSPMPVVYRVSFDASSETMALIRRAQEILRHAFPKGELDGIVGLALRKLMEKLDRERRTSRRHGRAPTILTRRVPESIKQQVWERDGGRCVYVGSDGVRCGTRSWLEYDHIRPWALGGLSDLGNVRLLCRAHNQFRARRNATRALPRPSTPR